jgi:hypothetical protein
MDQAAIKASEDLLSRTEAAASALESADAIEKAETAWSDFLVAGNRIFSKLEQGAKSNGKSNAWFGRKKYERRTIPLLRYIHHARNADEHGLAKVTERTAPGLALGVGPGAWRFDGTLGPGGKMKIAAMGGQNAGQSKFVEVMPSKVRLTRVVDSGVPYDPPQNAEHHELLPNEAANQALDFLRSMIEEAKQLSN